MKNLNGSKKIGIMILGIGAIYMIIIAWLVSWWYVPDYRQLGPEFVSGISWYTSIPFNIIWSLSAPVGSILVVLGFGLAIQVEKKRILFFIAGAIIFLWWLAFWYTSTIISKLYGIGGGIIIISFFISIWSWAKKRSSMVRINKTAADLRILGHLFFLIAAWGLCGILGSPIFGLRPELMMKFNTQNIAVMMGSKILICLVAGWILIAAGQFIETKSQEKIT